MCWPCIHADDMWLACVSGEVCVYSCSAIMFTTGMHPLSAEEAVIGSCGEYLATAHCDGGPQHCIVLYYTHRQYPISYNIHKGPQTLSL